MEFWLQEETLEHVPLVPVIDTLIPLPFPPTSSLTRKQCSKFLNWTLRKSSQVWFTFPGSLSGDHWLSLELFLRTDGEAPFDPARSWRTQFRRTLNNINTSGKISPSLTTSLCVSHRSCCSQLNSFSGWGPWPHVCHHLVKWWECTFLAQVTFPCLICWLPAGMGKGLLLGERTPRMFTTRYKKLKDLTHKGRELFSE